MFASNLSKTLGGAASLLIGLALLIPLFAPFQALAAPLECYCVMWLREARGHSIKGDAWTLRPSKPITQATEGDILLTWEGPGHAAEIVGFEGLIKIGDFTHPAYIRVIESNFKKCEVGVRLIPWDSPEIRGIF